MLRLNARPPHPKTNGLRRRGHYRSGLAACGRGVLVFFFTHLFYVRPLRGPSAHALSPGNRLRHATGKGGCSEESARTSLRSGMSPSTLAVPDKGRERRLAAKVRAAAKARSADQRNTKAAVHAARWAGRAARALLRARSLTNSAAWGLQRPPTSMPSTTNRQRRPEASSGYARALARSATRKAAPAVRPLSRRGMPAAVRGDTRVVSTASCTPPHKGRPLAMTSMRLSSWRKRTTLRSRTRACIATVAPASRHTLAAARSSGPPRERSTPDRGQAAR